MSYSRFRNLDPKLIVVAVLVLLLVIPVLIWSFQGSAMRGDFVEALRQDNASLPVDLRGKQWTEQELATAVVLKLPGGSGRERALSRGLHDRGRFVISPIQYQGTVTDETTGIVHVFGYPRKGPPVWHWASIHTSSADLHIQRRAQQLEEMKQQWDAKKAQPTEALSAGAGED